MEFLRPFVIGDHSVKLWCACVRSARLRQRLTGGELLVANEAPGVGDLVVVRVTADRGAYRVIDDLHGRSLKLYAGDCFVGVLGSRFSGTSVMGTMPTRPLRLGDRLDYLAQGGIVGDALCVPGYLGDSAMPLEVVGFPILDGRIANLRDHCELSPNLAPRRPSSVIGVVGTAAETGKTTIVCSLVRALKAVAPRKRCGVIKACGSGRALDSLRHADAGATYVGDFVDVGLPSTYGIGLEEFRAALGAIVDRAFDESDLLIVEVGGDLVEGNAPEAIHQLAGWRAPVVCCVSDAHSATAALETLSRAGLDHVVVASYRQNLRALAQRLGISGVIDTRDVAALEPLVRRVLEPVSDPVDHRSM